MNKFGCVNLKDGQVTVYNYFLNIIWKNQLNQYKRANLSLNVMYTTEVLVRAKLMEFENLSGWLSL